MSGYDEFAAANPALDRITRLMVERVELNGRIAKLEVENALLLGFARSIPLFTDDKGVTDLGTLKRMWFYAHTGLDEPVGEQSWGKLITRVDGMNK